MPDFIVKNYSVIEAENPQAIAEAVQHAISEGWEPICGIAATVDCYGRRIYTQALVQYEEEEIHNEPEGLPEECRECPMKDTCPIV